MEGKNSDYKERGFDLEEESVQNEDRAEMTEEQIPEDVPEQGYAEPESNAAYQEGMEYADQQGRYGYDPGTQGGYDPQQGYSYYGNNAGYSQQYGNPYYPDMDPRYAQQNMDPRYAQQNWYNDPRYAQQNMDPRYAQQYGEQYYGAQNGGQYYGAQNGGYYQNAQYSGAQNGGRNGYSERGDRYGRYQEDPRDPAEERRHQRGQHRPDDRYDDQPEDFEDEDFEDDDEYEEQESRKNGKKGGVFHSFKRKLSKIPARTLLLIGGGIMLLLVAVILLVVLLPKNQEPQEVVVADSPTPEIAATPVPTPEPTPEPTPTEHPLATPLEFGMSGDIVADIQQRLIDLGYMDYPVVDGVQQVTTVYGKTTKNAVRMFQKKNGLDTDGNCGQKTYDVLMSDQAKAFFLSRNDEGDDVKKLQEALYQLGYLNASATGYYGESTVKAVQKFQQANGLEADGKAGQTTMNLLYSGNAVAAKDASSASTDAEPAVTEEPAASAEPTDETPAEGDAAGA